MGFFGVLFVVFLVLKLIGTIAWSWWWVTAPLWGGFAFAVLVLLPLVMYLKSRESPRERLIKDAFEQIKNRR